MAQICTRYGYSESIGNADDDWITKKLIYELRTEQFEEPDNEHTQVSVGNEHWSVTAQVSGLITFDNLDILEGLPSDLPATMYLRDIPDSELIRIWRAVVLGDEQELLAHSWQEDRASLPSYQADYYRGEA
ncbi:MAG: hypothetical protein EOP84_08585 [Verrucomicrobiaceae bacterium]|nr:MAG: hypothetical protein EOP84_08585 [Verrucomicrobiaceae bacterium]